MVKKNKIFLILISAILLLIPFINAAATTDCSLDAALINQDPEQAVPGEYVKLVFQVTGVENSNCQNVFFELIPDYPIKLDPNQSTKIMIKGGTYVSDYLSSLNIPYKIRIDENAVDGENQIKVLFSNGNDRNMQTLRKTFNLSVENPKVDFELFVKNYNSLTNIITFQIINIGKKDVKALTLQIPQQDNIKMMGADTVVVGDLDSNDYTTADFESKPLTEKINVKITYTDQNNVRRIVEKEVAYNAKNFINNSKNQKKSNNTYYILGALILVAIIIFWVWRRRKRRHHINK